MNYKISSFNFRSIKIVHWELNDFDFFLIQYVFTVIQFDFLCSRILFLDNFNNSNWSIQIRTIIIVSYKWFFYFIFIFINIIFVMNIYLFYIYLHQTSNFVKSVFIKWSYWQILWINDFIYFVKFWKWHKDF